MWFIFSASFPFGWDDIWDMESSEVNKRGNNLRTNQKPKNKKKTSKMWFMGWSRFENLKKSQQNLKRLLARNISLQAFNSDFFVFFFRFRFVLVGSAQKCAHDSYLNQHLAQYDYCCAAMFGAMMMMTTMTPADRFYFCILVNTPVTIQSVIMFFLPQEFLQNIRAMQQCFVVDAMHS